MDLKNNQITVGEIIKNPAAKALLKKEFSEAVSPLMLQMARGMTLQRVLDLAGSRYPQEKINAILSELQKM